MNFWEVLSNAVTGVVDTASSIFSPVTNFIGEQFSNITGMRNLGQNFGTGFGKEFGVDFGRNFPTSFSLSHNINVEGKIEATVRVPVTIDANVNIDIKVKDLVASAQLIREGLSQFDIFGGVLKNYADDLKASRETEACLRDYYEILFPKEKISAPVHYLEISMVNESTQLFTDPISGLAGKEYICSKDCGLALSITVNGVVYIDALHLLINKSEIPTPVTRRIDKVLWLHNLLDKDKNNLTFKAKKIDTSADAAKLLTNVRLQIKLVYKTNFRRQTVSEWIFDGSSNDSEFTFDYHVNYIKATPTNPNKDALVLKDKFEQILEREYQMIRYQSYIEWLVDVIDGLEKRRKLMSEISSIASKFLASTFALDIRNPIYFISNAESGEGQITLILHIKNNKKIIFENSILGKGDEFSTNLPVFSFWNEVGTEGINELIVEYSFKSNGAGARATFCIAFGTYGVFNILDNRTISTDLDDVVTAKVELKLIDLLAIQN